MRHVIESRMSQGLSGAIFGATIDREDLACGLDVQQHVLDVAANSGQAVHLARAFFAQPARGSVGNFAHVRRSGTRENQFWGRAASAAFFGILTHDIFSSFRFIPVLYLCFVSDWRVFMEQWRASSSFPIDAAARRIPQPAQPHMNIRYDG
jgi:hypothetical protein